MILLFFGLIVLALLVWTVTPTVTANSQLSVTRTYSGGDVAPGNNTIDVNGLNTTEALNSGTTPAVTKDFDALVTLSGGAATLDLTAITDLLGLGTVTISGLTPAWTKFTNPSTNANAVTIAKGASNGYTGFGSSFSITLQPGGEILIRLATVAVSGSVKTLDITGTASQTLKVQGVAG